MKITKNVLNIYWLQEHKEYKLVDYYIENGYVSKEEYNNEKKLKDLNRIVTMYLDYAELQAENHNAMTMKDWIEKLNAFLQ